MRPNSLATWALVSLLLAIGGCGSDPHRNVIDSSPSLSEEDVREFISTKEKSLATGVGSSHTASQVEFVDIRFGNRRQTNERDRVVNGITGDTVHPVRVKYVSHRTWDDGSSEDKEIHYDYEFYQDEYGEWGAYLVGPVR